jgi:PAS domain S-box-containing protein
MDGKLKYYISNWVDVTERERSEIQLRETKEKYRSLVENANDGILVAQDGEIRFMNPKMTEISGYGEEETLFRPLTDFLHPEDKERIMNIHFKRLKGEEPTGIIDYRIINREGNIVWLESNGVVIDWEGRPATLNFLNDITKRKEAEEALRESESQNRAILDVSLDRILYTDQDMRIIWANKKTADLHGFSPDALAGKYCYDIFLDRDTPCEGCPSLRSRETGQIERAVVNYPQMRGMTGESYWDISCVPLKNDAGEIFGFVEVARDVTDLKNAEKQIHGLTHQLISAQETEYQMISRELHDRLAQNLSMVKIGCDTLFDEQPGVSSALREKASRLSKILQGSVSDVRNLSYDLRPPSLDHLGLVETIYEYCEEFSQRTGLNVDFGSAGMAGLALNFDTEINLYRLVQEGLNNVHKHAEATDVSVRLTASHPNIALRIVDNGKGFDVEKRVAEITNEKRMGLRSMEERVHLLKGNMAIRSRPSEGTSIFIKIPYEE